MLTGIKMNVTKVSLQLAASMKASTVAACMHVRASTFAFNDTWSDTVLQSAESLLVISPVFVPSKNPVSCIQAFPISTLQRGAITCFAFCLLYKQESWYIFVNTQEFCEAVLGVFTNTGCAWNRSRLPRCH
jgi:hypothetical protein